MDVGIAGVAVFLPDISYTNDDLCGVFGIPPERGARYGELTGILERVSCVDHREGVQAYSGADMLAGAGRALLSQLDLSPAAIDGVVCSSTTMDYLCPSNSAQVMRALGIGEATTFDLVGGCAEFLHGLDLAARYVRSGRMRNVLVMASEVVNAFYPTARYLLELFIFGDCAAAVLVSSDLPPRWLLDDDAYLKTATHLDGEPADLITIPISGCKRRDPGPRRDDIDALAATLSPLAPEDRSVHNARQVGLGGADVMAEAFGRAIPPGLDPGRDLYVIPHQPGRLVVDRLIGKLGVPEPHVARIYPHLGNLSTASVPVALWAHQKEAEGFDHVALLTVGAGMSSGALFLQRA